uniref:Alpha-L-iduronidase n=1 Tax=Strigamia maritima TaxID=126957 RepID=T1IW51_STRMM
MLTKVSAVLKLLNPPEPHEKADTFFLSDGMKLNLALIGGLAEDGDMQIRIHWLLQLVNMTLHNETQNFNFTLLDNFLDNIKMNGLKPGFEVMGNPSDFFRNFENKTEIDMWRHLVTKLATHYIGRYGLNYVQSWNFESWNEPDNHDFDNITMSLKGFLNYYDATSEGLLAANQNLRLGGPGNRLIPGRSPISWALLQHCYNGTNYYFTNKTDVRLDYLSIHQKGSGQSLYILQEEIKIFNYIKQIYPKFSHLPIYNDEADPLVGWNLPLPWRGDATYAAIIAKVISQHWHVQLSSNNPLPTYSLLSNDNAFLSYQPHIFEQRTLTARFQINNTGVPYVILIRKPAYNILKLLTYLGKTPLPLSISGLFFRPNKISCRIKIFLFVVNDRDVPINSSNVGAIVATHNQTLNQENWYLSALLYYSNDTNITCNITARIKLDIKNLPSMPSNLMASWYIMDNNAKTNPFLVWKQMGQPASPSRRQLRQMMNAEEPIRKGPFPIFTSYYSKKIKMHSPGVRLLHVCQKPLEVPGAVSQLKNMTLVSNIHIHNITSNIILISWKTKTVNTKYRNANILYRNIVSLIVGALKHLKLNCQGTLQLDRIIELTPRIQFFNTFHYMGKAETDKRVSGFYRIRVIDYWNRSGPYSKPFKYGGGS